MLSSKSRMKSPVEVAVVVCTKYDFPQSNVCCEQFFSKNFGKKMTEAR